MTERKISSRYAKALLDLAINEGLADTMLIDLKKVVRMIDASRELNLLIKSPIIQYWKKKKIIREIFEPILHKLTLDFLLMLVDHRREILIPSILYQYESRYNNIMNNLPVSIYSAVEINENTKSKIINKLNEITNMNILPDFKIDKSIKGGIIIKIDDWVFDGSIKNQLKLLYKQLAEGTFSKN